MIRNIILLAVTEPQSRLESELRSGRFVITAEVQPPLSASTAKLEEKIRLVKPYVTAINFTDGSSAIPRMSSAACSAVAASLGAEPVMQISARDNTPQQPAVTGHRGQCPRECITSYAFRATALAWDRNQEGT